MRTVKPLSAICRILATAFSMCAAECCGMETLSLDGLWDFSFSEGGALAEATAEFTADGKMPVPGCFDMMPPWRMKRGVGSYRRTFSVWRDAPSACLVVKGMGLRARFWLDGREIGASSLAWSELEFPIGALAAGEHVLAVAIDNTPLSGDEELFRPNYDFLASGGFYHGVELSDVLNRAKNRSRTFGGLQEEALRDSLEWAKQRVDYVVHTGDMVDFQSRANFDLVRKCYGESGVTTLEIARDELPPGRTHTIAARPLTSLGTYGRPISVEVHT